MCQFPLHIFPRSIIPTCLSQLSPLCFPVNFVYCSAHKGCLSEKREGDSVAQPDKNGWKSIAKTSRAVSKIITSVTTPQPQSPETFRTIFPKAPINFRYLLYDKKPVCLMNGILYSMYPIADPSLGYKLVTCNFDQKLALLNPRYITETQAMRLLFGY